MQLSSALSSLSLKKIKKSTSKKFLIFQGLKLSDSKIKKFLKFLIFSLKKAFLYIFFQKKAVLIFQNIIQKIYKKKDMDLKYIGRFKNATFKFQLCYDLYNL